MIACEEVRRHLPDYHYQLLPDWEAEEVRAHLQNCPTCQTSLRALHAETALFDRWQVAAAPASLMANFAQRFHSAHGIQLQKPPPPSKFAQLLRAPITLRSMLNVAGVASLLVFGGFGINQLRGYERVAGYTRDFRQLQQSSQPCQYASVASADHDRLSRWADDHCSLPSTAPDLRSEGLALIGVRASPSDGKNVLVWIYEWNHQEVLLFEHPNGIMPLPAWKTVCSRGHQFAYGQSGKLNVLLWEDRNHEYGMVSPISETAMAHMLANSLEEKEKRALVEGMATCERERRGH